MFARLPLRRCQLATATQIRDLVLRDLKFCYLYNLSTVRIVHIRYFASTIFRSTSCFATWSRLETHGGVLG